MSKYKIRKQNALISKRKDSFEKLIWIQKISKKNQIKLQKHRYILKERTLVSIENTESCGKFYKPSFFDFEKSTPMEFSSALKILSEWRNWTDYDKK